MLPRRGVCGVCSVRVLWGEVEWRKRWTKIALSENTGCHWYGSFSQPSSVTGDNFPPCREEMVSNTLSGPGVTLAPQFLSTGCLLTVLRHFTPICAFDPTATKWAPPAGSTRWGCPSPNLHAFILLLVSVFSWETCVCGLGRIPLELQIWHLIVLYIWFQKETSYQKKCIYVYVCVWHTHT